jgi:DNA invertase Pin-like site-specific DNA recombinase
MFSSCGSLDRLGRSLAHLIEIIGIGKAWPRKLKRPQVQHAKELIDSGKESRAAVAELFGVDVKTLRRALGPS